MAALWQMRENTLFIRSAFFPAPTGVGARGGGEGGVVGGGQEEEKGGEGGGRVEGKGEGRKGEQGARKVLFHIDMDILAGLVTGLLNEASRTRKGSSSYGERRAAAAAASHSINLGKKVLIIK